MLKPKKRITRHELKEDKLVTMSLQAKNYVEENYKQVLGTVFGIFAVFALVTIWNYYSGLNREAAAGILGIAQIEYSNMNYDQATSRLEKLIDEYGSTDEADQGTFLLANIYFQQKKYAEAREKFDDFRSSYSGSAILISSADAGVAACYEAEGNFAEAAKMYEKASTRAPEFPESENYLYLAGICYGKAGDKAAAKKSLDKVVADAKTTKYVEEAKAQLILMAGR
jgi:tetratricopeptide (TPR) repeat protein